MKVLMLHRQKPKTTGVYRVVDPFSIMIKEVEFGILPDARTVQTDTG